MINNTNITALPIGEFNNESCKSEFEAIIEAIKGLGANLIIANPVSDEEGARQSIQGLSESGFDLLIIIALRGLSAPIIETAVRMSHSPCLIWPVQRSYALPSSALAVGALQESGVPVELLYAPPDHPISIEKLRSVTKAAKAFSGIHNSRVGIIGGLFPNLVACRYDPQAVETRFGITFHPIAFGEIRNSIQSISRRIEEIEHLRQEITSMYGVNTSDLKALDTGIKLHLAMKQISREEKLDGFSAECWTGFPREIGLNPCLGFIEDSYTLACEGDVILCISLLMVRYLTGTSAYVGDLYDLDVDGILMLVHCGAPASLASNQRGVVLAKSQLAMERGFETMTCRPQPATGPVTLLRLYGRDGDKMHVAMGELLSSDQSSNLMVKISLSGDRWDFLSQCFGNHYVSVAGDIRNELRLLCNWLGIKIFET
jgi:L-fucose isomerase-like protein